VVAVKHILLIEVHQLFINGVKIPIGIIYPELLRQRFGLK
jgi:two-component system, LytTR family, response regulator